MTNSARGRRRADWRPRPGKTPIETIQELLEYLTEEGLFDVLAEMEDTGTLAAEREKLGRVPHPAPSIPPEVRPHALLRSGGHE